MARLALDQMFYRQIVEKVPGNGQGKAHIAIGVAKYRRQEKGAIGCGFQA